MTETGSVEFEALLDYLKTSRNFDFRAYKRPSLVRRVQRRMTTLGVDTVSEYKLRLESDPEEFSQLFNTVLINVTTFFRDNVPWDFLSSEVVPLVLQQKNAFDPIRVWSAGCATGEEAFTIAMVLAEALGIDGFRNRVKVYATDIDEHALGVARQAVFEAKHVESVPPQLLERYFEKVNGKYCFRRDLRRCVIFGRHDLLEDAPISKIDILICRNTLMYFNAPAQARILARLHFALNDGGFLFLGRAETLMAHATTFQPVDLKQRVFSKIPGARVHPQLYLVPREGDAGEPAEPTRSLEDDVRDAVLNGVGLAQVVVDRDGYLIHVNTTARSMFGLSGRDVGRPFQDVPLSYRPIELRSLIEQVYLELRTVTASAVEYQQGGEKQMLDVHVMPLVRTGGDVLGVSITFADVTVSNRVQQALHRTKLELEGAYEQLQSMNEEMETTNEELQSTVEELETTNEELQSTNEELETMNEELQSTNDELQAVNDVARTYTSELGIANQFLESIFVGLGQRLIVIDRDLTVIMWNGGAEDLWGVRSSEAVNSSLTSLEIGLPVDELREAIEAVLSGASKRIDVALNATNRRGTPIECTMALAPLMARDGVDIAGAIILTTQVKTNPARRRVQVHES